MQSNLTQVIILPISLNVDNALHSSSIHLTSAVICLLFLVHKRKLHLLYIEVNSFSLCIVIFILIYVNIYSCIIIRENINLIVHVARIHAMKILHFWKIYINLFRKIKWDIYLK